jgi:hypothetical protein
MYVTSNHWLEFMHFVDIYTPSVQLPKVFAGEDTSFRYPQTASIN